MVEELGVLQVGLQHLLIFLFENRKLGLHEFSRVVEVVQHEGKVVLVTRFNYGV